MKQTFDALILGGGPAGTAAALTLSRAGRRVALLERSAYDQPRIGETLPPEICLPLQRLGVWKRFCEDGHLAASGILGCWGSAEPFEHDFIFGPYGCGWHVARARFDQMLADAAQAAGATVWLSTAVQNCQWDGASQWRVTAQRAGQSLALQAPWVIDAAGRSGSPGHGAARYQRFDCLIGCVAFLTARPGASLAEMRTVIEACAEGWWYSAPLPDGKCVVALMSDVDLLPKDAQSLANFYWRGLAETTLTKRWLAGYQASAAPRRFAAHTSFRTSVAPQRLAAGDAALAYDPLSSQGVLKGLTHGEQSAMALLAAQTGEPNALSGYANALTRELQRYWQRRCYYYRAEPRWPQSPFWQRRQRAASINAT